MVRNGIPEYRQLGTSVLDDRLWGLGAAAASRLQWRIRYASQGISQRSQWIKIGGCWRESCKHASWMIWCKHFQRDFGLEIWDLRWACSRGLESTTGTCRSLYLVGMHDLISLYTYHRIYHSCHFISNVGRVLLCLYILGNFSTVFILLNKMTRETKAGQYDC